MANYVHEINLELGYPTVDEALRRLRAELQSARRLHAAAVKVIHGYGSTGKGVKIRAAGRKYLREEAAQGRVAAVIFGEHFSIFDEATRRAFSCCAALRQDPDLDGYNNGVTFVVFK